MKKLPVEAESETRQKNTHRNKDIPEVINETEQHSLLPSSTAGYLFDILADIKIIKEKSISDRQHSVHKLPDTSFLDREYQHALLFDICQIAVILQIDMNKITIERNIELALFGFFRLNEIDYKDLIERQLNVEYLLEDFISVMTSSHSYKYQDDILGAHFFRNYQGEYLAKLTEIVTLITSSDFKITSKENKGMEYYKNYLTSRK